VTIALFFVLSSAFIILNWNKHFRSDDESSEKNGMLRTFLLVLPFAHASDSDKTVADKLLIDKSHLVPAQILPPAPEFESIKGKAGSVSV
jgi:hypothetical protein